MASLNIRSFLKVEGLGNDFVLLDLTQLDLPAFERAILQVTARVGALCDRRTGVGADGILFVGPPVSAAGGSDASMVLINRDGSRPEMCGNGLRCVAHYLGRKLDQEALIIDTDAATKACRRLSSRGDTATIQVEMGAASFGGPKQPAAGNGRTFFSVSIGNPHAVHFVEPGEDPTELAEALGPSVERDAAYRDRTNVEFARIAGERSIQLAVWERGAGLTRACGTGACATAVGAIETGRIMGGQPITVELPGGPLQIDPPAAPEDPVIMTGPARIVFSGQI